MLLESRLCIIKRSGICTAVRALLLIRSSKANLPEQLAIGSVVLDNVHWASYEFIVHDDAPYLRLNTWNLRGGRINIRHPDMYVVFLFMMILSDIAFRAHLVFVITYGRCVSQRSAFSLLF